MNQESLPLTGGKEGRPKGTCKGSLYCIAIPEVNCIGCGEKICKGHQRHWHDRHPQCSTGMSVPLPYCINCIPSPYFIVRIRRAFNMGIYGGTLKSDAPPWIIEAYECGEGAVR
jgi:hypothetical protein